MSNKIALVRSHSASKDGVECPFSFSMAFQPIVNVETKMIYAYEALVRGERGEPSEVVLGQVGPSNLYAFDQTCRVRALSLAGELGLVNTGAKLSINFIPGAVYSPSACIQATLETARIYNFPSRLLIFEIVENEAVHDLPHLRTIVNDYRRREFKVALDDVGAGNAGLNVLAELPADILKLDMGLTRRLHRRPAARAIVKAMAGLAAALGSELIAEGVETANEYHALRDCGVSLMQGYMLARPAFEALPDFTLP